MRVGQSAAEPSRVLGARHAPPRREFGTCLLPPELPQRLCAVACGAADVVRDYALAKSLPPPPVIRVDCLQLPRGEEGGGGGAGTAAHGDAATARAGEVVDGGGVWTVNEIELADYASWQWGAACGAGAEASAAMDAIDAAVAKALAEFAWRQA